MKLYHAVTVGCDKNSKLIFYRNNIFLFQLFSWFSYHVTLQCSNGVGVCPDRVSNAGGTCREDNFDIFGCVENGITCVTYSRHFDTGESLLVSIIYTGNSVFVLLKSF